VKIVVLAVGKLRDRALRSAADEYFARLEHYARCEEIELRQAAECSRHAVGITTLVALEVDGEQVSSTALAKRVERFGSTGKGVVGFLIGGAEGIPDAVSKSAQWRLSLSSLTLPHQLARVILYEQLYRAFTILRGEPYAREN
jgi:23S rRNA (pseudouridine1915-N3)-methyltransferase